MEEELTEEEMSMLAGIRSLGWGDEDFYGEEDDFPYDDEYFFN